MGGNEESLLLPNGLLPNEAASVIRVLDRERWLKAEESTAELINCIQPNKLSEDRRNAVANYVQRLIMKCFPCQVFTFGSVPLKTYLPDGDIDLTAFSKNQNLKDTWAHQVCDMLKHEEKNENAEFHVKEVQYIQAEVKIIKCLVENIVVDISFNQLGGLCTLCFLEEVDNLINQDHLFKRSIILIKAWCYYESRILGAHHGLISTYALETLVLYIFHVFNNSFSGPLEVLYRFLEFFSKFDWDNFCVSLWGPVPIGSLPDVTAESPRKDGGELLLSKLFLEACGTVYAVFPTGQENQGQPFMSKYFNVIDPLRVNNNLGRSVSKGNFFRIRSAFAFGAKRLARLLDCPKEDLCTEVNQFFMNTWDRHGSGNRPDAPKNDLWHMRLSSIEKPREPEDAENNSSSGTSGREAEYDLACGSHSILSQHGGNALESISRSGEVPSVSHSQNQRQYFNANNTTPTEQNKREIGSNKVTHVDRSHISSNAENLPNELPGRYLFARTHSSPELTEAYGETLSQGRRNRPPDNGKGQTSARFDHHRRKNIEAGNSVSRQSSPRPNLDSVGGLGHSSNIDQNDAGLDVGEDFSSAFTTQEMLQEQQDLVNMMASSSGVGYNGQVHLPLNLASNQMALPIPPAALTSMGYAHRGMGGMIPTSIPIMDVPWGSNIQFPHGLVSPPFAHYIHGMGLTTNPEGARESGNERFGSLETNDGEADQGFWHEQEMIPSPGFDHDNGSFEVHQSDDKQQSTSAACNSTHSSQFGGSGSSLIGDQKFVKEGRGSMREDHVDNYQHNENRETEFYFDDRNPISRPYTGSLRSRASSESSWEGSSVKGSKPTRERRGRKPSASSMPAANYGKGKSISDHSSLADDDKDWNSVSSVGLEVIDRSMGSHSTGSLHVSRQQVPGFETAQTSASESPVRMSPILLASGSHQRSTDNSGALPYAFYPTGPPVPFVTMVPLYNFPTEAETSDASTNQLSGEEGLNKIDHGQTIDSSETVEQSEVLNSSSVQGVAFVKPLQPKSDILNSDFLSHWHNLQYGRLCQPSRNPAPFLYPSPVMVPPAYVQGRVPWDGLGRPLSNSTNILNHLMSHGPRVVPVTQFQTMSNRPSSVYQSYADEMPRYRGGTGTYLPNPKVSARDHPPTSNRKGNYNHDRSDHYGDREGTWNGNNKSRAGGRSHGRNLAEKSGPRLDRFANESRGDRARSSRRHETFPSYQSQNGPIRPSMTPSGTSNVGYGMHPLSSVNSGSGSSNGPTSVPSVVMLYPYDHAGAVYGSTEQLQFGSASVPVNFSGIIEKPHVNDGSRMNMGVEDQTSRSNSAQMFSPDQPSSPHLQR